MDRYYYHIIIILIRTKRRSHLRTQTETPPALVLEIVQLLSDFLAGLADVQLLAL